MITKLGLGLLALLLLAAVYVRLAPLPPARLAARPGPMEPGEYLRPDGIKVVRPLVDLPPDTLSRLGAIALATPRTVQIRAHQDGGPDSFVTRSRLWGFPDITNVWLQDGNLHIHARLVYGGGDLGVNSARVHDWLQRLEAVQ